MRIDLPGTITRIIYNLETREEKRERETLHETERDERGVSPLRAAVCRVFWLWMNAILNSSSESDI
jgi:hypothetical protein